MLGKKRRLVIIKNEKPNQLDLIDQLFNNINQETIVTDNKVKNIEIEIISDRKKVKFNNFCQWIIIGKGYLELIEDKVVLENLKLEKNIFYDVDYNQESFTNFNYSYEGAIIYLSKNINIYEVKSKKVKTQQDKTILTYSKYNFQSDIIFHSNCITLNLFSNLYDFNFTKIISNFFISNGFAKIKILDFKNGVNCKVLNSYNLNNIRNNEVYLKPNRLSISETFNSLSNIFSEGSFDVYLLCFYDDHDNSIINRILDFIQRICFTKLKKSTVVNYFKEKTNRTLIFKNTIEYFNIYYSFEKFNLTKRDSYYYYYKIENNLYISNKNTNKVIYDSSENNDKLKYNIQLNKSNVLITINNFSFNCFFEHNKNIHTFSQMTKHDKLLLENNLKTNDEIIIEDLNAYPSHKVKKLYSNFYYLEKNNWLINYN